MWNFQWELSCRNHLYGDGIHKPAMNCLLFTQESWVPLPTSFREDLKPKPWSRAVAGDLMTHLWQVSGLVSVPGQILVWVLSSSYSRGSLEKTFWVKLSYSYLAATVKQLPHYALHVVKFLLKTERITTSEGGKEQNNDNNEGGSRDAIRMYGIESLKADVQYTLGRQ